MLAVLEKSCGGWRRVKAGSCRTSCYIKFMSQQLLHNFFRLTPEAIFDSVEKVVAEAMPGNRPTGKAMALNSLENRVYDIELDRSIDAASGSGGAVVTKFYRPGRWTREQIQEEHEFLFTLEDAEIPVVSPWRLGDQSLFETPDGIFFALFEKVKGRLRDELDRERLTTLGRYIGRIHNVGEHFHLNHRLALTPEKWGRESMETILTSGHLAPEYRDRYRVACELLVKRATSALSGVPTITLHGDCHLGNTLWQQDAPFFLDFDDCMRAPPVQDIWMVVRGRGEEAERERSYLLEGYSKFRDFDERTLKLIEPLRALRMVHYSAWIARRWDDPSFPKAFPYFATSKYWEEDIHALQEVVALMEQE
jgi:Ser/Thr protein kinase RdoA (MazF antagonist)